MMAPPASSARAFTVLELLTVITILAILVAILLPSLSAARAAADRAQTRARFAQWTAAIEGFRREYGGYPQFDHSALVNAGAVDAGEHPFHDVLAGRTRDGGALGTAGSAAAQNRRRLAFHVFGDGEFDDHGLLCDATGNPSIAVLVDRNLDGVIRVGGANGDYDLLPAVVCRDGSSAAPAIGNGVGEFPAEGLRSGVVFYVATPAASQALREFVTSW
jgi:prepilin-type N-terminal cleavage/methylation domain-containing protein